MYEWDREKDAANRLKHGVGFEDVENFDWDSAVFQQDRRFDYGEERFRAFGFIGERPHCLAYVLRGDNIRIISLRPMHLKEARRYGLAQD
ncbi:BrnT family toxin [Devosia sp. YIM 151766]|uniref:BrnT family toxin n=1 Tax=Devosia sp. YIM 151766 TaxID=3017325 RepID=UPI00255CE9C1|nr:BrnT family toxin [Devosia sp. YIM 151766]WIY52663.1 BrnT family toxin [Devosia sp. YIM 151766]